MDQKQVAYLVPTTVLANQQYKAFKERMDNYPIRVEVLNRFVNKRRQADIIKKLKLGEVDIVIGTHRILSKDVEFSIECNFDSINKEKLLLFKENGVNRLSFGLESTIDKNLKLLNININFINS